MNKWKSQHSAVGGLLNRSAANIKLVATTQCAAGDLLKIASTEPRNDVAPLADSGRADAQRPRDIRGVLKVLNNVLLEHGTSFTTVENRLQPQSKSRGLTLVTMDKRLTTLADRLRDAMGDEISMSELARACGVSPAAVSKWLDGQTKQLKASNYVDAARALGVREEWLRTGKLPRERTAAEQEEAQADRILAMLDDLRGPLTALVDALGEINKARPERARKRRIA